MKSTRDVEKAEAPHVAVLLDVDLPSTDELSTVVGAWCTWWYRYRGAHQVSAYGQESALQIDEETTTASLLAQLRAWLPDGQAATPLRLSNDDPQGDGDHVQLTISQSANACALHFEFPAASIDTTMAARLQEQLSILLEELVVEPARPLDHVPLLSKAQALALTAQWTGPSAKGPFFPIVRTIEAHAARQPEAIAIQSATDRIRYSELDALANEIAHALHARGVKRDSPVVVFMNGCIELVASMLGIFKASGIYVPLDPSYPAARLEAIFEDVQPTVILTVQDQVSALPDHDQASVILVDTLASEQTPAKPLECEIEPEQTAYIIYTSGTTGRPKGVMISQANLSHYIEVARQRYGYHGGDVIPAMARPGFSISFFELLSPLACGGRLRLLSRDEVLDFGTMLEVLENITCIHASPAWWRKMLVHVEALPPQPERFATLRHVSSGGDMVPPDVLEALKRLFAKAEVFVIYGSSEIACMGCSYPVPRDRTVVRTRVGRPFPNMLVRLLDPAGGVVPPGFRGEVCFGGAGLATGYLDAPQLTADKFPMSHSGAEPTRLYHTGDVGVFEPDDQLRLVGRRDFQIKLRGVRIEPAEIEARLRGMPQVRDAVVVARTDEQGDARLVAYLVAEPDQTPSPRALRRGLRAELPEAMVPTVFVGLEAMPVNHNGKVDRRALPPPTQNVLFDAPGGAPPTTALERQLLDIWRDTLGQPSAGIDDDFFDLGGDSLGGAKLMTQIDEQMGVPLPVSELLRHPTVAQLAGRLVPGQQTQTEESAVVCLRPGRARPAFFFIHDGGGETIVYRNLARDLPADCPIYGVHPKRSGVHPILHTRIAEMVDYYTDEIRKTCSGPYVVGGLCIGGFLAFEVARALQALGEEVPLVALLDAPHVAAPKRGTSSKRFESLGGALGGLNEERSSPGRLIAKAASTVARKAYNATAYELTSRAQRRMMSSRIRALRVCLDHGLSPPAALQHIGVDPMLRFAELEYVVPETYQGELLLVRATRADPALEDTWVDDTPYSEIIDAPAIGWEGKATSLHIEDVDAGHSSMLQRANAPTVASAISRHVLRVHGTQDASRGHAESAGRGSANEDDRITAFVEGCSMLVVMVSYRSGALVVNALASLETERPHHEDMRVVVVDNTSGDDAALLNIAIAERGWGDWVTVRVAPKNGGFAYGNNLALRPALRAQQPPPCMWLLNPDTQVRPGASVALRDVLDQQPRAGLVGSCMVEASGQVWGRAFRFPSLLGELEASAGLGAMTRLLDDHVVARVMGTTAEQVDWLSGSSVLVRREALEAAGLLDEGYFLYFEETDFCLAAHRAGWQAWYAPDSEVVHYAGSTTGMSDWFSPSKRVPGYYFESRRRFFVKNYGLAYATMTDAARLTGLGLRAGLRILRGKERAMPQRLLWDSLRSAAVLGPRVTPRR